MWHCRPGWQAARSQDCLGNDPCSSSLVRGAEGMGSQSPGTSTASIFRSSHSRLQRRNPPAPSALPDQHHHSSPEQIHTAPPQGLYGRYLSCIMHGTYIQRPPCTWLPPLPERHGRLVHRHRDASPPSRAAGQAPVGRDGPADQHPASGAQGDGQDVALVEDVRRGIRAAAPLCRTCS